VNAIISKFRGFMCAAAAGLCLACSAPSWGAAFQVTFDPVAELYGTAIFDLTEPCLANDNNYNTFAELLGLALSGCVVSLESAHVSMTGIGGPYSDYVAELPFVLFSSLLVIDNQLAGLTTLIPIRLEPAGGEFLSSALLAGFFHDDCDATLSFTAPSSSHPSGTVTFVGCGADGRPLTPLGGNIISITRVPEPGSLALLFGAGFAGWWVRRRRRPA
jgi:hypothetical protein